MVRAFLDRFGSQLPSIILTTSDLADLCPRASYSRPDDSCGWAPSRHRRQRMGAGYTPAALRIVVRGAVVVVVCWHVRRTPASQYLCLDPDVDLRTLPSGGNDATRIATQLSKLPKWPLKSSRVPGQFPGLKCRALTSRAPPCSKTPHFVKAPELVQPSRIWYYCVKVCDARSTDDAWRVVRIDKLHLRSAPDCQGCRPGSATNALRAGFTSADLEWTDAYLSVSDEIQGHLAMQSGRLLCALANAVNRRVSRRACEVK